MEQQHYDAIVIGSGLGGLTAGALWAKQGKKVLVVERHDKFGGAATLYERKRLEIEVGLHELCGFGEHDLLPLTWNKLGLDQRIERVGVPSFFGVRQGQEPIKVMPEGWQQALDSAVELFPNQGQALQQYFQIMEDIRRNIFEFVSAKKNAWWWIRNLPFLRLKFRAMFKYNKWTVSDLFDALFGDDEAVKFYLAANIGYYSDQPQELSAVFYAIAQGSFHQGGGHYIKGGSQQLSNALIDIIKEAGGDALIRRTVTDILFDDQGKVCGIAHEKNLTIGKRRPPRDKLPSKSFAPVIFGNAAPTVLEKMLPQPMQKEFSQPYKGQSLSPALWVLFIGFDCDPKQFGVNEYATFIIPEHVKTFNEYASLKQAFSEFPKNEMPGYVLTDYSKLESGMNSKGRNFAVLCGIDDANNWQGLSEEEYYEKKAAWENALLNDLDKQFPGIKQHIVFHEMGTARSMNEYLNTPEGATYGFAQTAPFIKNKPPSSKTSVPGLFISSAFGSHGGGFVGAMLSGSNAAKQASKWANNHVKNKRQQSENSPNSAANPKDNPAYTLNEHHNLVASTGKTERQ